MYQQPQRPHPRLRRFLKSRLGIGCMVLLLGFAVCTIAITAIAANSANNTATATPTATTAATQAAILVATTTVARTVQPTQKPTQEPTQKPTPMPTPHPQPTQPPPKATPPPSCQAVNNNPWCYNFLPGKLIYVPPNGFCSYFNCIATFYAPDDPGDGYIVECQDSTYSQSGGESGACSSHGGVLKSLYSH